MALFVLEQNLLYSVFPLEVSSARLRVVTYTCNTSLEKANVGRFKLEVSLSSKNRIEKGVWRDGLVVESTCYTVQDVDLVPRTFIRWLKPAVTPVLG